MGLSAARKKALISLSRGPVSGTARRTRRHSNSRLILSFNRAVDHRTLSKMAPTALSLNMCNIYKLLQEIIQCATLSKLKISSSSVGQDCRMQLSALSLSLSAVSNRALLASSSERHGEQRQ